MNILCYYHNIAFDGSFIINELCKRGWKQAYNEDIGFFDNRNMPSSTFKYIITDTGRWYTITLSYKKKIIEFRDSWKLIPFSVKTIGKSFGTKHQKLDMEYKGFRYSGCEITEEEKHYIRNDVLVVKEALEKMYASGHKRLTIGSCCLAEFKKGFMKKDYNLFFPNLQELQINEEIYTQTNAWDYINQSYSGGWCYVVEGKAGRVFRDGVTADVNSLYPSVMHSASGNYYPVGKPIFWSGNFIPERAKQYNRYYFIRVKTRFKLRKGFLPFIHIRRNKFYRAKECLKTSDVKVNGYYHSQIKDKDGEIIQCIPELTLTMTDWILFNKHYELYDTEIISGCYFNTVLGIFDNYINHYAEIKVNSKGAERTEAKLFLNNLYGKMAANINSSYKVISYTEDGLQFKTIPEHEKKPGYIPVGSAITSYARNFTINAAQLNYHGVNKPGFIYADTDSIHCDVEPEDLIGIETHPTDFLKWKLESRWDEAYFTRPKTYIEHITHEDLIPIPEPYYNIKCAGMPQRSKDYFQRVLERTKIGQIHGDEELPEEVKQFITQGIEKGMTIKDFNVGLEVPGKLLPKQIRGGVVLVDVPFQMRPT